MTVSLTSLPPSRRSDKFAGLLDQMRDMAGVTLAVRDGDLPTQSYRNPFDISRRHLLDQVVRMRANFMQTNVSLIKMQDQVCRA